MKSNQIKQQMNQSIGRSVNFRYGCIVWDLSLQSDPFLHVVGTIIANVQYFTWKKSGDTVYHFLKS